jgi:hypothetical protein
LGKVKEPEPAMLFIGMLYADSAVFNPVEQILKRAFGETSLVSRASTWEYSEHYREEFGWPLTRKFVFFRDVIDPESLPDIKVKSNEIEDAFSIDNKRRINLDPGYLTLSKIVLASTKNYAHRIYLRNGIYGEITLYYQDGMFRPHLFTYRDYQEKSCLELFTHAREMFRQQLQGTAR